VRVAREWVLGVARKQEHKKIESGSKRMGVAFQNCIKNELTLLFNLASIFPKMLQKVKLEILA